MIVVFAIWAVLGFRIVKTIHPVSNENPYTGKIDKFSPPTKKLSDTFSILANYRDPFLGTLPKTKQPNKQITVKVLKEKEVDILYTGYVKENTSGAKIFFITLEGEQRMMSKNMSFREVKLLSGNSEMIKVSVAGRNKSIPLSK